MNTTRIDTGRGPGLGRMYFLAAVLVCWPATAAWAGKPVKPLETPLYAFDAESPQVVGTGGLGASDVLTVLVDGLPAVHIPGADLGMGQPGDELDALSRNQLLEAGGSFVVLFSVDRITVGTADPDPVLTALGVPHNAKEQAARGHAAGDLYLTSSLFTLLAPRNAGGSRVGNNTLVINNYNEGGTEFGAQPLVPAGGNARVETQDRVSATAADASTQGNRGVQATGLYFSATATSPSLSSISSCASVSGATILFNLNPGTSTSGTYACYDDLGLAADDEIDAMVVMDAAGPGTFGIGDRVLFSLAPLSPSLASIPGASPVGAAADVFIASFGIPPVLLASAGAMGIGAPDDNIDALEVLLSTDASISAQLHGIRVNAGIPTVSEWGLMLMALLMLAAGGALIARRRLAVARVSR
jgi:hypothetical protein